MPAMIVAPEPVAVEAGARVLQQGGNAIDAAVTCAFAQMITNPQMCGVGGYTLALVHRAGEAPERADLLDAPALAGSRANAEMWQERVIGPNPDGWGYFLEGQVNDAGYQSICTPGTVRGLATLLARYGTIPWHEAIQPAITLAEQGFMVDTHLASRWKTRRSYPEAVSLLDYVMRNNEARRIYLTAEGRPYDEGEHLRNPDYGRTLRRLAERGPDDFYTGELAHEISADLAANGAFVTAADLAGYQVRDEQPVVGTYRGHTVVTSQAPHGGPTLVEMLNILEGYDLAALGHNTPEYITTVALAMRAAFADRSLHIGDPYVVEVPDELLASKERAATWRAKIAAGESLDADAPDMIAPGTTHVSVVDAAGTSVALTHSLGASSGVITPGLGFMYNNSMINFHPLPGHRNSIAPGKARSTGMAPTIVSRDGRPILVLGAPGASRIITGVLQVMLNVLDFGMSAAEAVLAPRFDCQGERVVVQNRIPEYICEQVRERLPAVRIPQSHGAIGLVQAITIGPDGKLAGGADSGCGGMALLVGEKR
jgi:gamma-glutamyltranspeptidase/glutathione hydrolase